MLYLFSMTISKSKIRRGHPQTNPKSLANLIPYKPGENGHKGGYNMTERLRHALDHPLKPPDENSPVGERLVYSTLKGAIELVPTPFREAWDRAEGKVTDTHELKGEITLRIVDDDDSNSAEGADNTPP